MGRYFRMNNIYLPKMQASFGPIDPEDAPTTIWQAIY